MELRYLVRSNHLGKPETVLQYITFHENGYEYVWKDVPTVYTEEVMNDHHRPEDYEIS